MSAPRTKHHQLFVVGAAGELNDTIPDGLKGYGNEEHWAESMEKINGATGLVSPFCIFCCPCFVVQMMLGGGLKDHLNEKVAGYEH